MANWPQELHTRQFRLWQLYSEVANSERYEVEKRLFGDPTDEGWKTKCLFFKLLFENENDQLFPILKQ